MNSIPIFLASDEKYAMFMAVTITSILANTSEFIDFYVLDGGISIFTKNKIYELEQNYQNFSIEYIKIDMDVFKDFPNIGHFSLNMYHRYLIPSLKLNLKKVLYIDSDTVVNGDIKELYEIDLSNFALGAVPYLHENEIYKKTSEYKWATKLKKKLEISQKHLYFNSGILLMDLNKFRENNIQTKLFELTNNFSSRLECPDQDILNKVFENNYKILDEKYNVVVDLTNELAPSKIEEAFILHYTGKKHRPWLKSGCIAEDNFWTYAKQTPFYDELRWKLLFTELQKANNLILFGINKHEYLFNKVMSKITFGKLRKNFKSEYKKYNVDIK